MEMYGVMFAGMAGMFASPMFCAAVVYLLKPRQSASNWAFWTACGLLLLFSMELVLVGTFGIVGARELVGPLFFSVHCVLTLALPAALAVVLLLAHRLIAWLWPLVAVLCWCVGIAALLYQCDVGMMLYGKNGHSGPYVPPY